MSTDSLFQAQAVFNGKIAFAGNFARSVANSGYENQDQTTEAFSDKWTTYAESKEKCALFAFQQRWFLTLYGFADEESLAEHLQKCRVIFDAGCGLGYKAAWFARLAPNALVIGMDFSEAAAVAAQTYCDIKNLFFVQGDIASTGLVNGAIDFTCCDQVIMHTEDPEGTFRELTRITSPAGEVACYFYARKALPRELLDDYFRNQCKQMTRDELWAMSQQLTELGRRLSALKISFNAPDVPALGIKGGEIDLHRFIYWNFIKCFWNSDLGHETSIATNFDWYSPSNARRFNEAEVRAIAAASGLDAIHFHAEEACYSGRFRRP